MSITSVIKFGIEKIVDVRDLSHPDMADRIVGVMLHEMALALKKHNAQHYGFCEGNDITREAFKERLVDEMKRVVAGKPPYRAGRSNKTEHSVEEPFIRGSVEWHTDDCQALRVRITVYGKPNPD